MYWLLISGIFLVSLSSAAQAGDLDMSGVGQDPGKKKQGSQRKIKPQRGQLHGKAHASWCLGTRSLILSPIPFLRPSGCERK